MNKKTILIALLVVVLISVIGLSTYLMVENEKQQRQPPSILLEIPSSIALDDKLLGEFLIEQKIIKTGARENEAGLIFTKVIREDLNKDAEKEIIIGLGFEGPSMGWIGLIKKDNERYFLSEWESTGLAVLDMSLRNLPQEREQSLIVKIGGKPGTGLFQQELLIYLLDRVRGKFSKLIWRGFLEEFGVSGSVGSRGVEANYNIEFKDIDEDGDLEIIQTGVIKEIQVSETFEYVTLKETPVRNIFKYSHNDSEYKLSSDRK